MNQPQADRIPSVHPALAHPDPNERTAAIDALLTATPPEQWAETLGESLADPHRGVRERLATAFGERAVFDPSVLEDLCALARNEADGSVAAVRQRVAVLFALAHAALSGLEHGIGDARQVCLDCLQSASPHIRFQALAALRRLGVGDQAARVHFCLEDRDREVVSLAAEVLAQAGDTGVAAKLAESAKRLKGDARARAVLALGQLARAGAAVEDSLFQDLVDLSRKVPHGMTAIDLLADVDSDRARPHLDKLSQGWFVHRLLRVQACAAMARLEDPRGLTALRVWTEARHDDARGFAIEKLAALGDGDDIHRLLAIVRDRDDYHSDTALVALATHVDDDGVRQELLACVHDPREEVRAELAGVLRDATWGGEALARLMNDADSHVARVARGEE